jgi:hypothetical protein
MVSCRRKNPGLLITWLLKKLIFEKKSIGVHEEFCFVKKTQNKE